MTEYVIDLDERQWIGIPPAFPYLDWEDAAAWAADLARAAVPADAESRAGFEQLALQIAAARPASVDHILWFAPTDGSTMGVAYLTVLDDAPDLPDLDELAVTGLSSSPTPVQVRRQASAPFGEIIVSAATIRLSDMGGGPEDGVAGSLRIVGAAEGLVFMMNAVDEDLQTLALMEQPMMELMDAIELLTDESAVHRAAARLSGGSVSDEDRG